MDDLVPAGTWVELHDVLLGPGARAPQVPDDTHAVPLERRVKGHLVVPAILGETAEIVTPSGRLVRGRLDRVEPAHTHTFGPPVPELAAIGPELRALLRQPRPGVGP